MKMKIRYFCLLQVKNDCVCKRLLKIYFIGARAKFDLKLLGPAYNWPQLKTAGGNRPALKKMDPTRVYIKQ